MRLRYLVVPGLGFTGLVVVGLALLVGPPVSTARVAVAARPSTAQIRHVFLRDCATCHGANAHGTDLAPSLHGVGAALVDYYLSTGRMPLPTTNPKQAPERGDPHYSRPVIDGLVRYVTDLAGGGGPAIPRVDQRAGDLAQGGSLFQLNCAACHSWSGAGGALLDRSAPSLHAATPVETAEAVRGGPGNMPAFGTGALSARQVDAVVRYVQYLRHPDDRGGWSLWHLGPLPEGAVAIFLGLGAVVFAIRRMGTKT
jgi:ubiquinol-cytochrome c reductase cytochrome c subunit